MADDMKTTSIPLEADVNLKKSIVKNIFDSCQAELNDDIPDWKQSIPIERAALYTGISTSIIKSLDRPKHLEKTAIEENYYDAKRTFKTRYIIQMAMKTLYLEKRILPLIDDIADELNSNPIFLNKPKPKENLLYPEVLDYMGYTWQKLPGIEKKFLIEKPEYVNERFHYLTKITQYRKEGRLLVFIYDSLVPVLLMFTDTSSSVPVVHRQNAFCCRTAICPKLGLISYKHHTEANQAFTTWIVEYVLPAVPKGSVIITDTPQNVLPKKPSKYSSKREMMEWLERNHVPFRNDMHKVELYQLVKLHKPELLDDCGSILSAKGFIMLRRPRWLPEFDLFIEFHETIALTNNMEEICNLAAETSLETYAEMDKLLEKKEKECLEDDRKIEETLDKVLEMVGKEGLTAEDIQNNRFLR